jgi:hypothetical protein
MLDPFIETNNLFLAKRVVIEELNKIKGITENLEKKYYYFYSEDNVVNWKKHNSNNEFLKDLIIIKI